MYKTTDIARILNIKPVTVRKYAAALEKSGHNVQHSASGHREYSDTDVTLFKDLQALQKRAGLSVEKCADVVVSRHKQASGSVAVVSKSDESLSLEHYGEQYDYLVNVLKEVTDNQKQIIDMQQQQIKQLQEQSRSLTGEILIVRTILEENKKNTLTGFIRNLFKKSKENEELNEPDPERDWNKKKRSEESIYDGRGV